MIAPGGPILLIAPSVALLRGRASNDGNHCRATLGERLRATGVLSHR